MATEGLSAVILGATGATGRCVLGELMACPAWVRIRTLGRRAATVPEEYKVDQAAEEQSGRLEQRIAQLDELGDESLYAGADTVFCCLGTTRKAAGSAEAFRQVDLIAVAAAATGAKRAGVKHFSLVSSQSANASSWFLYMQTKGEAEQAVQAQEFERVSVWRPGLLERGDAARWNEKLFAWVAPSMPTSTLARAMRIDAERAAHEHVAGVSTYGNGDIREFARAGARED